MHCSIRCSPCCLSSGVFKPKLMLLRAWATLMYSLQKIIIAWHTIAICKSGLIPGARSATNLKCTMDCSSNLDLQVSASAPHSA